MFIVLMLMGELDTFNYTLYLCKSTSDVLHIVAYFFLLFVFLSVCYYLANKTNRQWAISKIYNATKKILSVFPGNWQYYSKLEKFFQTCYFSLKKTLSFPSNRLPYYSRLGRLGNFIDFVKTIYKNKKN
jgi:hypothetical protein